MTTMNKMYTTLERKEVDAESRTIVAWGSRPVQDRDKEIIDADAWDLKNFQKNPVLMLSHNYSLPPIGRIVWIKATKEGLRFKAEFAKTQMAEEIWSLYRDEFMRSFSVGFIAHKWEDPDDYGKGAPRRIYKNVELLEISCVSVPSCPDALLEAYNNGTIKTKEFRSFIEDQLRQIEIVKGESDDGNEKQAEEKEQAKEIEGSDSSDGEKGEVEYDIIIEKEEEEKFCECEEPDFVEDECRGCGGRRKPRKPKKEFIEEIEDVGFGEIMSDEPNPLEIKLIESKIQFPEIHSLFVKLYEKSLKNQEVLKSLDIASLPSKTNIYALKVFCEFLSCKVKNVYRNDFVIPWPLAASYLMGYKTCAKDFTYLDTRSFGYGDTEFPPSYELMKVNSKIEEDFLIEGTDFFEKDGQCIVVSFNPVWAGIAMSVFTSRKNVNLNRKLISDIHKWVETENPLKGEKFGLSRDFIEVDENDTWDTVILDEKIHKSVKYAEKLINTKKKDFSGRGMLFIGPPGTGKTKTGRILMTQTDHTFIWASSKDFARSYYTAEILALAFKMARQLSPSILFLEDIDSWVHGNYGVIDLMKTELDGIKKNSGVITILTTNNPEKLPDALLDRPGRFHDVLNFDLPSDDTRRKMLRSWIDDIDADEIEEIVERTKGFSGAHMWELIEFAKTIAEDEDEDMYEALCMSLEKLQDQKELISTIRGEHSQKSLSTLEIEVKVNADEAKEELNDIIEQVNKTASSIEEIEIKAGRTLSKKTREIIQRAIDALNDLMKGSSSSEDEEDEEDDEEDKKLSISDISIEKSESIEDDKIEKAVKEVISELMSSSMIDAKSLVEEALKRQKGKMF